MAITLDEDTRTRMIESIKRYCAENMEEDIGDLKASLLLDFCLREIAPSVYNRAVADAQSRLHEQLADLDGSCHEPEFGYWDGSR